MLDLIVQMVINCWYFIVNLFVINKEIFARLRFSASKESVSIGARDLNNSVISSIGDIPQTEAGIHAIAATTDPSIGDIAQTEVGIDRIVATTGPIIGDNVTTTSAASNPTTVEDSTENENLQFTDNSTSTRSHTSDSLFFIRDSYGCRQHHVIPAVNTTNAN